MKNGLLVNERTVRRVATASMVGTIMEWYDFFLYGFVAALVFGQLFFPSYSAVAGTLASFATLAVGFVARPLGGILFGHFGDRIGRKAMLITTLALMGGATFAIGLLPTYQAIGVWAPVLLVICRFLQGIALGGEWGGAVLMAVEYAPSEKRGFFGSVVQLGATLGLALATTILFAASFLLSKENFLAWGWRVPFLASVVLLVSGLWIRLNVTESPAFQRMRAEGAVVKFPVVDVLRHHWKLVVCTAAVYLGAITVPFYTVWVFLVYYATAILKVDRSFVLLGVVVANLVLSFAVIAGGSLSDRLGRPAVFKIGLLALAVVAFPFFMIAGTATIAGVWIAMFALGLPLWLLWGALPAYFCELFPQHLRYTGVSLGSQAATIIGGLVPFFSTAVLPLYGTWPISALIVLSEVLAIAGLLALTARRGAAPSVLATT